MLKLDINVKSYYYYPEREKFEVLIYKNLIILDKIACPCSPNVNVIFCFEDS